MIINAQAALRFLELQPPGLEQARGVLAQIVEDGMRAGDIVDGIRALFKKTPSRKEHLDINAAIRGVMELTRGEVVKSGSWCRRISRRACRSSNAIECNSNR